MKSTLALGLMLFGAASPVWAQAALPPVEKAKVQPSAATSSILLVNRTKTPVNFSMQSPNTPKTRVSLEPGMGATLALKSGDPWVNLEVDAPKGETMKFGMDVGQSAYFVPHPVKGLALVSLTHQGAAR